MIENLRVIGGAVWLALLWVLYPAVCRTLWKGGASAADKVMTVVALLAVNRLCFNLANQYASGQEFALAFCHVFGTAAGIGMAVTAYRVLKAESR